MKHPLYSLRIGILAQLTFLILAAMLLINVVAVKFSERDLIQARAEGSRLLVAAIEQYLGRALLEKHGDPTELDAHPGVKSDLRRLLSLGGCTGAFLVGPQGEKLLVVDLPGEEGETPLLLARKALQGGPYSTDFRGTTWGVVWLAPKEIYISSPLSLGGPRSGGIALRAPLMPVYEALRNSEKLILLYIFLDTLVLAIVGLVLLGRIVVSPIHKLLKMTAEYKEGDLVPSLPETSRNEIGELTRSLAVMLRRLSENKMELRAQLDSLAKANKELQQAQNEIIRSEKLASIGRLAAGVAHEIGNPIGIALGYLDLLNRGGLTEEEKKDFLSRIESEVTRVNRIIKDLLNFSRPSEGRPEEIHAHDVLLRTIEIIQPQPMMEEVEVDLSAEASEDTLLADPDQLQQVFLNIIMNAVDALSGKGGKDEPGGKKRLTIVSRDAAESLEIRFSDTGEGIPEEELGRIFDPFYTTKEPGKGTGLGLAVCYRIVERMGGSIRAESVRGQGTSIVVSLPRA